MAVQTDNLIAAASMNVPLSYEQIATHVGSSKRSVQRWVTGESSPMAVHYQRLAPVVYPRDPELASRIARAGGTTLEALGLVKPPPPPPPALPPPAPVAAPPPPPAPQVVTLEQADAIVCAAADVLDIAPKMVREVVAAAFIRAHRLGYTTEALAHAFEAKRPAVAKPPPAAPPAKKG